MKKYPSIDQFRHVVRAIKVRHDYQGKDETGEPIYRNTDSYPIITFEGTVKLHGTNASVVKYKDRVEYQSRESVLSLQHDNYKFMLSMMDKNLDFLFEGIDFEDHIAIYGEWCGEGIQKGIAISELPKMFVIFGCKVDGKWIEFNKFDNEQLIFNINQFKTWQIDIDFNQPEMVQNQIKDWTIEVENECPVGKHFGISGIGEGIVFKTMLDDQQFMFKSKGEKHSASRVETIAAIDVDKINSMNEFVDYVLTESRLNQGIEKLKEMQLDINQKSTGDFLRWIVNDVIKEEEDTIVKNQLDPKKINVLISNAARKWYFNYLQQ
jgi:hypothetical protein